MIIEPYHWQRVPIEEISKASIDTVYVKFRRPDGYTFRAGQYTIIRLHSADGQRIMRQYSFSSAPNEAYLECTIQKEIGGEASTWFFDTARVGDEVEISQAFGNFTLDPVVARPLLFIAGRVGVAPFMSLIRDAHTSKTHVDVLYSVRNDNQICFRDELAALNTTFFVTGDGQRLTREIIAPHLARQPLTYLCGSRDFVEAMQEHLLALDVPAADIRRELFTL